MTPASQTGKPNLPRARWGIACLLGFGVLVNYFDRVNLSVSQQALHASFGISTIQFGYLLAAYSWTYMLCQIPAGVLLDRFGVRSVGRASALLWSVASFAAALSTAIPGFFLARLLLGVGEASTFPGSAKAVDRWFPDHEKGRATAMFDSAAKLAPAIGIPAMGLILVRFGWRWCFAATGVISLLYFALFALLYRDPASASAWKGALLRLRKAKEPPIEDSRQPAPRDRDAEDAAFAPQNRGVAHGDFAGFASPSTGETGPSAPLSYLARQRKVWGLAIGFGAYNYTFYLILTWLPSYLLIALHLDILHSALYTGVPWLCAAAAELLVGGWLLDALIGRGFDPSRVRQAALLAGMTLGLGIFGAAHAHTIAGALFWITLSLSGVSATGPVVWAAPGLIAPANSVGKVGGMVNFATQIPAIAAPILTGYVVAITHSFVWAFVAAAAILFVGMAGYIFLLGRLEPVPEPAAC